jgi:bacterial/archaeal transporter family-2 protein
MPSYKQGKAEISLKLRNRAADMGLADAKSRRRSRHPAMAHHGTKQVVRCPILAMIRNVLFSSILAVLAGVSIVIQQTLNANLRGALSSAAWSGFASYAIGLGCMGLFALALRDPIPSVATAGHVPLWAFSSGLFGAIFIGLAIFLVPQLGAATFIVLLVTGQMLASVTFDHFGWLGLTQRPIDLPRLIGIALLIGACVLIRR